MSGPDGTTVGSREPGAPPAVTPREMKDLSTVLTEHQRQLRVSLYETLARAVEQAAAGGWTASDLDEGHSAVRGPECLEATSRTSPVPVAARVPRVLDVGCGRGELLQYLEGRGFQVEGLDPEPECVRIASHYAPCWLGSGEQVGELFPRGDFDVIVSSHVLEHVPHPFQLLRELREMKARVYVFAVPNLLRPARLLRALAGSSAPDHPAHLHSWGRPELEALLQQAGFRPIRWHCDRVTVQPFTGGFGARMSRWLTPLETSLLPRFLPLLSSSLIVTCEIAEERPPL